MTCALTVPDFSDPGQYPEESGRFGVGIFRGPKVFASAKVRVYIIQMQLMFWYYENGDGNLAVVYASERYDV